MENQELEISFKANLGTISTEMIPAIQAYAKVIAEPYKNAIVTEEGIKDAKSDRANLNKVKEAIEKERKRIKGIWNTPYQAFEVQLKNALEPIDDAIANIDTQVKDYEKKAKEAKKERIINAINEDAKAMRNGIAEVIQNEKLWARVYSDSFCNASFSEKKAKETWTATLNTIVSELDTIADDAELLDFYVQSGSIATAMNFVKEKRAREEQLRKMAEERARLANLPKHEEPAHLSEVIIKEPVKEEPVRMEENPFTNDGKDFKFFTIDMPTLANMQRVRAKRIFVGERWKVEKLFKYAEALGLEIIREEN